MKGTLECTWDIYQYTFGNSEKKSRVFTSGKKYPLLDEDSHYITTIDDDGMTHLILKNDNKSFIRR